jgi:hypothetical protein
MFIPDLLHKFELGVWKAFFIHMIRILYAIGQDAIQELNFWYVSQRFIHYIVSHMSPSRYHQVLTFRRDTIWRFGNNASAMKRLAGQDFEDLLQVSYIDLLLSSISLTRRQCAIPAFEGLLPPPHNDMLLDTLFILATWHTYAKLHLHTKTTLTFFEWMTTELGMLLLWFIQVTCSAFKTKELPQEEAVRGQRRAALGEKKVTALSTSTNLDQKGKQLPSVVSRVRHGFGEHRSVTVTGHTVMGTVVYFCSPCHTTNLCHG